MSLRRVCPSASFVGCADVRIADATERSGDCKPGMLFAAIPGTRIDGAHFVGDAIARGAKAVLVERPLPGITVPQCVVPSVRRAYAELCSALHGHPSRHLGLVGVTGTNGKTTVTWLARSILRTAGHTCGLLGTIEYDDGRSVEPSSLTTPDSAELADRLARMVAVDTRHAAIELSSHALHQNRAAGTDLDVAIVTNVTRDHFDYHNGFEDYVAAKARIAERLKFGGRLVVNNDDPGARRLREIAATEHPDADVTTFGIDNPADVRAEIVAESLEGMRFRLVTKSGATEITSPLVGRHNVSNALAAAAAALHLGVELDAIRCGIEATAIVPGRLERIDVDRPFDVFVDYAHTPDALERVVRSLVALSPGRVICVFGAGGDRDREKRPELGRAAALADVAIVTSDNPRSEHPERIIEDILPGLAVSTIDAPIEIETIIDRADAIRRAVELARPGDCIVVAGKGHEREQIVGDERRPFDDREFVRAACDSLVLEPLPLVQGGVA